MTLSTLSNRVSQSGDGVSTVFNFPNKFLLNVDLVVLLVVDATGVETTQVLDTDYTVAGAGDPAGGTVTFVITPPPATDTVVIYRDPAKTQLVDLVEGDPLPVDASVETPFDKLTMIVQRICDVLTRTLHLSDGDPTDTNLFILPTLVDRANKFLAFDENGIPKGDANIPKWITGDGVPDAGLGNDGDMYIDLLTGDLYGPKTAGAWGSLIANFTGPTVITTVFGRIGAIVAAASDYDASQVDNDSGIVGAFVSDALDTLGAAITAISHPIDTVFGRTGAVIGAASDYDASQVDNDSGVVGAFISDALDTLDTAIGAITHPITTVFGRSGVVVATASDYDASQVDNDSGVGGATVADALDTLDAGIGGTRDAFFQVHVHNSTDPDANGSLQLQSVAPTGSFSITFVVPSDFISIADIFLTGYSPNAAFGGSGTADIDLRSNYAGLGEDRVVEQETDTTSTYVIPAFGITWELDVSGVFSVLAPGDMGSIHVTQNFSATAMNWYGLTIRGNV